MARVAGLAHPGPLTWTPRVPGYSTGTISSAVVAFPAASVATTSTGAAGGTANSRVKVPSGSTATSGSTVGSISMSGWVVVVVGSLDRRSRFSTTGGGPITLVPANVMATPGSLAPDTVTGSSIGTGSTAARSRVGAVPSTITSNDLVNVP